MSDPIELVENPTETDFEDYIAAYLQAGGLYVEKSIIYRGKEELLELDIITSNFKPVEVENYLIEIKSGKWGFKEIFKVKGWLCYLKMKKGIFIVKKDRSNFPFYKKNAEEIDINLINNSDLSKTEENLKEYLVHSTDEKDIESIRFSYWLERNL